MQTVRSPATGQIVRIFNLESVDDIAVRNEGREIWITLKSGHSFMVFELVAHADHDVETIMKRYSDLYKKISKDSGDPK